MKDTLHTVSFQERGDMPKTKIKLTLPILILVVANCIPVLGVLLFGWDLFPLIFVYWLENAVIGMFAILKLLCSTSHDSWKLKAGHVLFFSGHYSVFCLVHGTIVVGLFGTKGDTVYQTYQIIVQYGLQYTVLALVMSHGFSFVYNYIGHGEYRNVSPRDLMFAPYRRVVALHVVVFFGGIAIMMLGVSHIGLLILVLIKIVADVFAHDSEHSRARLSYAVKN